VKFWFILVLIVAHFDSKLTVLSLWTRHLARLALTPFLVLGTFLRVVLPPFLWSFRFCRIMALPSCFGGRHTCPPQCLWPRRSSFCLFPWGPTSWGIDGLRLWGIVSFVERVIQDLDHRVLFHLTQFLSQQTRSLFQFGDLLLFLCFHLDITQNTQQFRHSRVLHRQYLIVSERSLSVSIFERVPPNVVIRFPGGWSVKFRFIFFRVVVHLDSELTVLPLWTHHFAALFARTFLGAVFLLFLTLRFGALDGWWMVAIPPIFFVRNGSAFP